jgi:hypothetical protein
MPQRYQKSQRSIASHIEGDSLGQFPKALHARKDATMRHVVAFFACNLVLSKEAAMLYCFIKWPNCFSASALRSSGICSRFFTWRFAIKCCE